MGRAGLCRNRPLNHLGPVVSRTAFTPLRGSIELCQSETSCGQTDSTARPCNWFRAKSQARTLAGPAGAWRAIRFRDRPVSPFPPASGSLPFFAIAIKVALKRHGTATSGYPQANRWSSAISR